MIDINFPLMFYKNGELVETSVGVVPKGVILNKLERLSE